MARHIIHVPVKPGFEPRGQPRFGVGEVDAAHAHGIETQLARPLSDPRNKAFAIGERPGATVRCDIFPL